MSFPKAVTITASSMSKTLARSERPGKSPCCRVDTPSGQYRLPTEASCVRDHTMCRVHSGQWSRVLWRVICNAVWQRAGCRLGDAEQAPIATTPSERLDCTMSFLRAMDTLHLERARELAYRYPELSNYIDLSSSAPHGCPALADVRDHAM